MVLICSCKFCFRANKLAYVNSQGKLELYKGKLLTACAYGLIDTSNCRSLIINYKMLPEE